MALAWNSFTRFKYWVISDWCFCNWARCTCCCCWYVFAAQVFCIKIDKDIFTKLINTMKIELSRSSTISRGGMIIDLVLTGTIALIKANERSRQAAETRLTVILKWKVLRLEMDKVVNAPKIGWRVTWTKTEVVHLYKKKSNRVS